MVVTNFKNYPDVSCYLCEIYTGHRQLSYKIIESSKYCSAYRHYFGMLLANQDKPWAPHMICVTCRSTIEGGSEVQVRQCLLHCQEYGENQETIMIIATPAWQLYPSTGKESIIKEDRLLPIQTQHPLWFLFYMAKNYQQQNIHQPRYLSFVYFHCKTVTADDKLCGSDKLSCLLFWRIYLKQSIQLYFYLSLFNSNTDTLLYRLKLTLISAHLQNLQMKEMMTNNIIQQPSVESLTSQIKHN